MGDTITFKFSWGALLFNYEDGSQGALEMLPSSLTWTNLYGHILFSMPTKSGRIVRIGGFNKNG